jgi:hypothetical protein
MEKPAVVMASTFGISSTLKSAKTTAARFAAPFVFRPFV